MTAEQIKADLAASRYRDETDAILKSAYAAGFTLRELGAFLGCSGERVRQRIRRPVNPVLMRDYAPHKRLAVKIEAERKMKKSKKRILGLPTTSTALEVPVSRLYRLRELADLVTTVRGWTPLDDPARLAIKEYGDLLYSTIKEYAIPQTHLEKLLGCGRNTLTVYLRNHGYLPQCPSQKSYRGVLAIPGKSASKPMQLGGLCRKKKHVLTEKNFGKQSSGNYCKDCVRERRAIRYQQRKLALSNP